MEERPPMTLWRHPSSTRRAMHSGRRKGHCAVEHAARDIGGGTQLQPYCACRSRMEPRKTNRGHSMAQVTPGPAAMRAALTRTRAAQMRPPKRAVFSWRFRAPGRLDVDGSPGSNRAVAARGRNPDRLPHEPLPRPAPPTRHFSPRAPFSAHLALRLQRLALTTDFKTSLPADQLATRRRGFTVRLAISIPDWLAHECESTLMVQMLHLLGARVARLARTPKIFSQR
jgi:hypothetical protein